MNSTTKQVASTTTSTPRPIHVIAKDIRNDWKNLYFGAKPYLDAMDSLTSITDSYGYDSAREMVVYFLANAATWKGEKAREIKKELKSICTKGR